jgi:hypothetical protein
LLINFYKIFNYASLAVVIIFIILMLTQAVPREWYVTLVYIGIGLLVLRIISRIYITSYQKKLKEGDPSSNNQNEQTED